MALCLFGEDSERMDIEFINVSDIKPYKNNTKRHPADQVKHIANSIREFGFRQPLVIDKDNVLVIGHGRLQAAKRLKLKVVPVTRADDLTEQQINALRIADNSTNESDWNIDRLRLEIDELPDFDMGDFGLDIDLDIDLDDEDEKKAAEKDDRDPSCQHNVFENQERAQYTGVGFYEIPEMDRTDTVGDQMLRVMDYKEVDDLENYIGHFYYDDYKFIQAWRDPDKYIKILKRFKAVISPDFSLYTDFPRALQILSCYRRQWVGRYWQEKGIDVIPDVVWGDEASFSFCFDGIPEGGTVAVSTVGVADDDMWNGEFGDLFLKGYNEMLKRLSPSTVLFYGNKMDGIEGNVIFIPPYYRQKFG